MTRASSILFWFTLIFVVTLGLYQTSYKVEQLDRQLRSLNASIDGERRNIHILKAEWVYLSNPARIEAAARKHLKLEPTKTAQIAPLNKLASLLPDAHAPSYAAAQGARVKVGAAAPTPRAGVGEKGRLNTHLVMVHAGERKTAASGQAPAALRYQLAGDESYGIGEVGYSR